MNSEDGAQPTLVYAVGRVSQGIQREMRKRLAPWNLSVPDYTTLSVLERRPGLSNAQLSRRALITPQSMFEVLASLERRGLVEREVDPQHGRIRLAALTPSGRATLRKAAPSIAQMQEEMLADVPPHERDTVLRGILSAMQRLSAGLEGDPGQPAE